MDGTPNPSGFGSWQLSYNGYVQNILSTSAPNLCTMDWRVNIGPTNDELNPGAGTVFNLARWGMVTTLLDDGFFALNSGGSNYRSAPLLDETGLINAGTTGLSKGWLGQPFDPPQRTARDGVIWWRRYDNGIVIINTNNGQTGSTGSANVNISLFGGAGIYKRITGSQDSGFNDGSVVNADFSLNQIDAIVLEKI